MAPGLDYLNDPYDSRDENYFNSLGPQLVFDFAGPWAVNKGVEMYLRKTKLAPAFQQSTGPSKIFNRPPLQETQLNKMSGIVDKFTKSKASRATAMEIGATATRYGKMFGIAGAVIGGYQIGKSLLNLSKAFEMDPDEIAKNRRKQLYGSGEEYFDTRAAFTQRQRAIQVIHNSQLSGGRRAFGEESSWLHM